MNYLSHSELDRKTLWGRSKIYRRVGWLGICLFVFGGYSPGQAQEGPPAGPAYQSFPLTLDSGTRTETTGPFYYRQQMGTERTRAWPPFYSRYEDPDLDSREDDVLYPLLTYDVHGQEYRWQLFQLFSFAGGGNPGGGDAKRFTIYPVYFRQRSSNTNDNYTAVVPFYGHIRNRLMINDVFFVMFPFYSETKKKDVVTDNYVYPFFHIRHGDHLAGWQFWPAVGSEHKDVTTATNGFGDVSVVPGHDKFFAVWPFYFDYMTGIGSENPQKDLYVIPFYVRSRSPNCDSTSVLWPFFTWVNEREKKYHEWQGPWPFVIFTRGEGKHTDRVWPIFSQSHNATRESDSYLWPLYQYHGYHSPALEQNRTRVFFYLFENTTEKNVATGATKRRVDMWPFFQWHRDAQGSERLQVLALVEPALPDFPGIERNWSPLWALWRAENNAVTGHQSRSLLWNLYRSDSTPATKKWSLLFGLFQYNYADGGRQLRCFYGPVFHWHKQANVQANPSGK